MLELRNKRDSTRLCRLGAFGNTLRSWERPEQVPEELRASRRFSLRNFVPGGPFLHNMPFAEMAQKWTPDFYVCEPAPDEYRIVQGEIMRVPGGLYFRYSFAPLTLRTALLQTDGSVREATGGFVYFYLNNVMTQASFIELTECLDLDPDAIVELTVFSVDVGDRPGRNTIIWEVRSGY